MSLRPVAALRALLAGGSGRVEAQAQAMADAWDAWDDVIASAADLTEVAREITEAGPGGPR